MADVSEAGVVMLPSAEDSDGESFGIWVSVANDRDAKGATHCYSFVQYLISIKTIRGDGRGSYLGSFYRLETI